MLQYVAIALAALALWLCPFWVKHRRVYLPLYFWAIYSAVAPVPIFGKQLLDYRWELGVLSGLVGFYWWWTSPRRSPDAITIIPAAFTGLSLTSVAWSALPDYTLYRALGLLPVYCFTFMGIWSLLCRRDGIQSAATCCLAYFAIAVGLVSASPVETGMPILGADADRFMGHLKATGTATVIVASMPFVFWRIRHGPKSQKWVFLPLLGFWLLLLLATRTRGSLLSFAIFIPPAWTAIVKGGRAGTTWLGSLAFACATFIALQFVPETQLRAALRAENTEQLIATRVNDRWDILWDRSLESPLIGHGSGMSRFFLSRNPQYDMSNRDLSRWMHQTASHNEFLTQFYELGFLAPLALLAFFARVLRSVWKAMQLKPSPERNLVLSVGFCAGSLMLDTMLHDGYLTIGNPHNAFFWTLCFIVIAGEKALANQNGPE